MLETKQILKVKIVSEDQEQNHFKMMKVGQKSMKIREVNKEMMIKGLRYLTLKKKHDLKTLKRLKNNSI